MKNICCDARRTEIDAKEIFANLVITVCKLNSINLDGIEFDSKLSKREDTVAFHIPEFEVGIYKMAGSFGLYCSPTERALLCKSILNDTWNHCKINDILNNETDEIMKMVQLLSFLSNFNCAMQEIKEERSQAS